MPDLYIIAGPNRAGKTTAAYTLLPEVLGLKNFVNAAEIACGLSPFDVESVAFEAGRIMWQRMNHLMAQRADFAFETTLATRSYGQTIQRAKALGYTVNLFFVYLTSPELAVERVVKRVAAGGHNVPAEVVHRRYERALANLFSLYLPICDYYVFINNSGDGPAEVAEGGLQTEPEEYDVHLWEKLKSRYGTS